jgi:ABC-2 type transport system ATP-binding protein
MIEARDLTKRYGQKLAVDQLSFSVQPGKVTGFLGPNGAGKSTTMRLILGLDRPHRGVATIGGKPYRELHNPLRTVGALLEARSVHTGRTAFNHLLFLAQTQGLPRSRVMEVINLVGLGEVANRRTGGFSLGMSQRLGIAAAMLGDPAVLVLDEPVNGLDPEGILWIRNLMKRLAAEGRTVFVSSHLMNEMSVTADHLIVIGRGRLIADCSTREFVEQRTAQSVLVRTPHPDKLASAIAAEGGHVAADATPPGAVPALTVTGMPAPRIGELAAANSVVLHELTPKTGSLEEAFMEMTADSVEYGQSSRRPPQGAPPGPPQGPLPGPPQGLPPGPQQGSPPGPYGPPPGQPQGPASVTPGEWSGR